MRWASYVPITRGTLTYLVETPETYQRHISVLFLRSLLRAIAQFCRYPDDDRGEPFGFPSVDALAAVTSSTPRSVRRGLRELEQQGLIFTLCGGGWARSHVGRTSTYTLQLSSKPANLPGHAQPHLPGHQDPPGGAATRTHGTTYPDTHAPPTLEELPRAESVDPAREGGGVEVRSGAAAPHSHQGAANGAAPHPPTWPRHGSAEAASRAQAPAANAAVGVAAARAAFIDAKRRMGSAPGVVSSAPRRQAPPDRAESAGEPGDGA